MPNFIVASTPLGGAINAQPGFFLRLAAALGVHACQRAPRCEPSPARERSAGTALL